MMNRMDEIEKQIETSIHHSYLIIPLDAICLFFHKKYKKILRGCL
jgi:hypothetical protein